MSLIKRLFYVISTEEAKSLGLEFSHNIHGDMINNLNCRSIWKDHKNREYRVNELYYEGKNI